MADWLYTLHMVAHYSFLAVMAQSSSVV